MLMFKVVFISGVGFLIFVFLSDIYVIVVVYMLEVMYKLCLSKDGFFVGEIFLEEEKYDVIVVGLGFGRMKEMKKVVE